MDLSAKTINTGSVTARIEWSPRFVRNANSALQQGGNLQKIIDSSILESIEPYIPFDTGSLVVNGLSQTITGSGRLVWETPYAHYLYTGLLYVDPDYRVGAFHDKKSGRFWSRPGIEKVKTDVPLKFRGGGKRGARWPERWIADNLQSFEKSLTVKAGELLRR